MARLNMLKGYLKRPKEITHAWLQKPRGWYRRLVLLRPAQRRFLLLTDKVMIQQAINFLNDIINSKIDGMADGILDRLFD